MQLTGLELDLDLGFCKTAALTQNYNNFVVKQAGKSYLLHCRADSRTLLNHDIIQFKGEALAVADALDKARYFVLGCKTLTIAVEHIPLLRLFR